MSSIVSVQNGIITGGTSNGEKVETSSSATSNGVDSDTFLKLLVAEMQYQDPLEPTSNTEWVSQYATFTQVEKLDELGDIFTKQSAYDLAGKSVIVKDDTTSTGYTYGTVDYVTFEDGEIKISVGEDMYSLDDIDSVVNSDYLVAMNLSAAFTNTMSALPSPENVILGNEAQIEAARAQYDALTDYQKTFISQDDLQKLLDLENNLSAIKEAASSADNTGGTTDTDGTAGTDGTGDDNAEGDSQSADTSSGGQ